MTAVEWAQIVGGLASFLTAFAVMVGGSFAYLQLRTAAKASRLDTTLAALQFIASPAVERARGYAITMIPKS